MKRLIVAIILLFALIGGCFAGYAGLDRFTREVTDGIAAADALLRAENPEGADDALQSAYRLWRSRQPLFGAIVRHDELDDIENLFLRAMQCLDDREEESYRLQSRELRGMLRHVPEMERPSIQNVF